MQANELQDFRAIGDELADKAIAGILSQTDGATFFGLLHEWKYNAQHPPAVFLPWLGELRSEVANPLSRAEKEAQVRAFAISQKYLPEILHILGFYSLPYCYAAADGAQVLVRSQKIMGDPGRRLSDTADFVLNLLEANAFEPTDKGITSMVKTRLIHAASRAFILRKGEWKAEWGLPVNQEDMAGTLLSFSLVVLRGLAKLGASIPQADKDAFIRYWNVIGLRLGLREGLLADSYTAALQLEGHIKKRHFKESEAGKALSASLLNYYIEALPDFISADWVREQMRYLLGAEVADLLALPGEGDARPKNTSFMMAVMGLQLGRSVPQVRNRMAERKARL